VIHRDYNILAKITDATENTCTHCFGSELDLGLDCGLFQLDLVFT